MNQKPTITLNEALQDMETGKPCDLIYRSANRKKKTAGVRKELSKVILHSSDWANSIRTFRIIDGGQEDLRDVHIRLIIYYNGRRVIW